MKAILETVKMFGTFRFCICHSNLDLCCKNYSLSKHITSAKNLICNNNASWV
jgi:hypothetical protein